MIEDLKHEIKKLEALLLKCKTLKEVQSLEVFKKFESYLDQDSNKTVFLDEFISFSTMLKTFKNEEYLQRFEKWLDENDEVYRNTEGKFYLKKDVTNLMLEIGNYKVS